MTTSQSNNSNKKATSKRASNHKLKQNTTLSTLLLSGVMLMLLMATTAPILIDLAAADARSKRMKELAMMRKPRDRKSWTEEKKRHSISMFFRLFRMKPSHFDLLCQKITNIIGSSTFKSEEYLQWLTYGEGADTRQGVLYRNSRDYTGDYVSGEWKLAMTLRYLAGAKYLDLYLWSNIHPDYAKKIVNDVIKNWLCNDDILRINFYDDVLLDKANSNRIRREFSSKTGGIINGCIGAVDGWLVKIRSPSMNEVVNPGKYYSRKNVYGINVQVIVDKKKKILWRHIGEVGSSHDSQVFHDSRLGKCLQIEREYLAQEGLYLVGDSAYALRNYLLCPFDCALPHTPQDTFNYFLSSARIFVECCFGEVDRRWGILWGPIEGNLKGKTLIVDACLRLHNYILEQKELEGNGIDLDLDEIELLDESRDVFNLKNPTAPATFVRWADIREANKNATYQLLIANNEDEEQLRLEGKLIRDQITEELWGKGLRRPESSIQDIYIRDRHNRAVATVEDCEKT